MRLTCPNCGAEYDVPAGMIPASGRHVQCTACHTRWFVRDTGQAERTEEQILRRLETVVPRPSDAPFDPAAPAAALPPDAADTAPPPLAAPDAPDELPAAEAAAPPEPAPPPARLEWTSAPPRPPAGDVRPPRPAPRLDLGRAAVSETAAPPPRRSRFGLGMTLAILLAALALGAYIWRDDLAARLPAAAPALAAWGETVDGLRTDLADLLDRLRGSES